ncbi:hypothetical protein CFP56_028361 [Quercus suber]|uniref:Uncharacterized protein n=1 Tax=Quercus suber TaxID=58331 RepID=A0AAW0JTG6_QUESU
MLSNEGSTAAIDVKQHPADRRTPNKTSSHVLWSVSSPLSAPCRASSSLRCIEPGWIGAGVVAPIPNQFRSERFAHAGGSIPLRDWSASSCKSE